MRKILEKIPDALIAAMLAAMIAAMLTAAHATTATALGTTGGEIAYCELAIKLGDKTGGRYAGSLKIKMRDVAAGYVYEGSLRAGDTFKANVVGNTTYIIGFDMDMDKWEIRDAYTNAMVFSIGVAADDRDISVNIVERKDPSGDRNNSIKDVDRGVFKINLPGGETKEIDHSDQSAVAATPQKQGEAKEGGASQAEREEAARLFSAFKNAIESTKDDPQYSLYYANMEIAIARGIERYTKYAHIGATAEEWEAMSLFERRLWTDTYLLMMENLYAGSYDSYFGTESKFMENTGLSRLTDAGVEEYRALMKWQYKYILAHGTAYNFVGGYDYLHRADAPPSEAPKVPEQEIAAIEKREEGNPEENPEEAKTEIAEAAPEKTGEAEAKPAQQPPKEQSVWETVGAKLKGNIVTMAILAAALIALAAAVVIKKRKRGDVA